MWYKKNNSTTVNFMINLDLKWTIHTWIGRPISEPNPQPFKMLGKTIARLSPNFSEWNTHTYDRRIKDISKLLFKVHTFMINESRVWMSQRVIVTFLLKHSSIANRHCSALACDKLYNHVNRHILFHECLGPKMHKILWTNIYF